MDAMNIDRESPSPSICLGAIVVTSREAILSVVLVGVVPLVRGGSSSSTVVPTSVDKVAPAVVLVPSSVDVAGLDVVLEVLGRAVGMNVSRMSRITSGDPAALASVRPDVITRVRSCTHNTALITCKNVRSFRFLDNRGFTPLPEGDRSRPNTGP